MDQKDREQVRAMIQNEIARAIAPLQAEIETLKKKKVARRKNLSTKK